MSALLERSTSGAACVRYRTRSTAWRSCAMSARESPDARWATRPASRSRYGRIPRRWPNNSDALPSADWSRRSIRVATSSRSRSTPSRPTGARRRWRRRLQQIHPNMSMAAAWSAMTADASPVSPVSTRGVIGIARTAGATTATVLVALEAGDESAAAVDAAGTGKAGAGPIAVGVGAGVGVAAELNVGGSVHLGRPTLSHPARIASLRVFSRSVLEA